MSIPRRPPYPLWRSLADDQHGVLSRGQLIGLGRTPAQAGQNLSNRRWQAVLPGV